jgi:hypothetical protein
MTCQKKEKKHFIINIDFKLDIFSLQKSKYGKDLYYIFPNLIAWGQLYK